MEHILRRGCLTALQLENANIITIYRLLTELPYQKQASAIIQDPMLKRFWLYEFNKAGDYQQVEMVSPITNKLGMFLDSTLSKNIVGQVKTTIDFDDIL